jgi:RNA polymerase sigma-70 factor (ECF subfamily)
VLGDRQEAEDVVQEALARLPQAHLRDPHAVGGWLYTTCYRQAIDALRARQRRTRALKLLPAPGDQRSAESEAERGDEARRVRRALEALDDPYRTAVTLRYLQGRSFKDVAAEMNALERTVRTWVGRGLTRLRRALRGPAC